MQFMREMPAAFHCKLLKSNYTLFLLPSKLSRNKWKRNQTEDLKVNMSQETQSRYSTTAVITYRIFGKKKVNIL